MERMGHHELDDVAELAGKPIRRARAWAWVIFWSMAGTSVLYNCYHAFVIARMPWYTGIPESVVPLLLAIGMLEIAAAWKSNRGLQAVAWGITAGAMAWSAVAINPVVRLDAPLHWGFLFGLLADTAALGAMYFLLNGPAAAQAVARVAKKITELTEQANAERRARNDAEANAARTLQEMRAAREAERETERQANDSAFGRLAEELEQVRGTGQREANARQKAEAELAGIRTELAAVRAARQAAEAGMRAAGTAQDEAALRKERQVEALHSQLDAARSAAAMRSAIEAERDAARRELVTVRAERDAALTGREEAERSAANAETKAERLTRKIAAQDGPKAGRSARTETVRGDRTEGALTPAQAREKAYEMLDKNPDLTGAEVGEPFGFGDRWGQKRKEEYEHRNGLRAVGEN